MAIPTDCGDNDDQEWREKGRDVSAHFWKSYDLAKALFCSFGTLVAFLESYPKAWSAKTTALRLDHSVGSRKRNVGDFKCVRRGSFSGLVFR